MNTQDEHAGCIAEVTWALHACQHPALSVTLNTYRNYSDAVFRDMLRRFGYRLHRSLFRARQYGDRPTSELIRIYGAQERVPGNGAPHVHLIVWLPQVLHSKFSVRCATLWLKQAPHGSVWIERVREGVKSARTLASYNCKDLANAGSSYRGFFTESDLDMPEFGGSIVDRRRRLKGGR
jgi:hypothetical protein